MFKHTIHSQQDSRSENANLRRRCDFILDPNTNANPDRNPDHSQNAMDFSLVRDTALTTVSCKYVHYFISNPADRHTYRPL